MGFEELTSIEKKSCVQLIKNNFTYCNNENHSDNNERRETLFCAWYEECGKKSMSIYLKIEISNRYDYILFTINIPDNNYELIMIKKLEKIKSLIDKYIICPEDKKDINYLIIRDIL